MNRSLEILKLQMTETSRQTERMFGALLLLQWLVAVGFALWVTPQTWFGAESETSLHLEAALGLGGLLTLLPLAMMILKPAHPLNRFVIAISQMLFSALLIHLTGGRIETHFHIFGSLALLAFFRDWRVLVLASLTTAADHFARGLFWPGSVYGVFDATYWRTLEHVGWVLFEDTFLIYSMNKSLNEAKLIAKTQAELEAGLETFEDKVRMRTKQLEQSNEVILNQQQSIVASTKSSALGEIAGQIAHEINAPLGMIVLSVQEVERKVESKEVERDEIFKRLDLILQDTSKIARLINSMRKITGVGANEPMTQIRISEVFADILALSEGRFRSSKVELKYKNSLPETMTLFCHSGEISQILVTLLNHAFESAKTGPQPKVEMDVTKTERSLLIRIVDSGVLNTAADPEKLFASNFSQIGQAVGFNLSLSKKLIQRHGGMVYLDSDSAQNCFVVELPLLQAKAA